MRTRDLHRDYYRDRFSEDELCRDFPGDELFIRGLNTMQVYMWNNGVSIDIPVVRVMNTAHFLAAYMFSTTCSGDQLEYDALADMSLGRDKQLFRISIIVLAAMLKRTEGFRAKQCRNVLLENRDPDFDEGVTLYDRFLRSAEERFAEEDFLIDTQRQIQRLIAQNEQLAAENRELKIQYRFMQNQQNIQYIGTQNNNCTQIAAQYNFTYVMSAPTAATNENQAQKATVETPASDVFCRITREARENGKAKAVEEELRRACISAPKLVAAIRTNEALGYLDTQNLSSKDLYDLLNEHFALPFTCHNFTVYRSRNH